MAYDFERRRRREKVIAGSSSILLLLLLVVAAVAAAMYEADDCPGANAGIRSTNKSVKMLCATTDYKETCETSLTRIVNTTVISGPKDVLQAAVVVVIDEISKSFSQSRLFKTNDSRVQDAIDDCWEMYQDSEEDLEKTLSKIINTDLESLPEHTLSLKSWLSAVFFYQETCVDGFPEGELKNKMRSAMKTSTELTSNALAMIGRLSDFLTMLNIPASGRRLLSSVDERAVMKRAYPSWVSEGDRRLLRERINVKLQPNVTVARDGSGDFRTINEAIHKMPLPYDGSCFWRGVHGAMGFRNTVGPRKHQAVALRVQSDRSIFINRRMEGYQDTLYAQSHRQFYRGCVITGTIDFVFGDASAVFQNCLLLLRRPLDKQKNIVTAHGRSCSHESTGFVIQHCRIKADRSLHEVEDKVESYLGRPWKEYSRTVFMENLIGSFIHPAGYLPWDQEFGLNTLYYAAYNNKGEGSNVTDRVK
ncbi:pectinesterase [Cocos nucifera]|uniref:Pectinesterase n=1 Tax=Cocos nucifera TaxID=13894 RepID=A0A8K0NAJ5_COCNU|nr:pectinesterase [Cocos nucifera]